jgi:GNAT superfamily N-acetyltransferase
MLRPMTTGDVPAVAALARATFADLDRRLGLPDEPPATDLASFYPRYRHPLRTDPGGAWVAEHEGEIRGAALAIVREGVWGLSLLVVSPSHQSTGIGRSLLANTVAYGADAPAGIILSSEDHRALRAYSRAGFAMRPAVDATGPVRVAPAREPTVRPLRWPQDADLVDAVGRHVRGAGHGRDVPAWLETGCRIEVHEDGGFSVRHQGRVVGVAALAPEIAAGLLRSALRQTQEAPSAHVMFVTAGQEWAVETLLDAGLDLRPAGAVMVRGKVGPLAPYLPSGAYL